MDNRKYGKLNKKSDQDLDYYIQKTMKSMYIEILNVVEDVFVDEIAVSKEKWDRVRTRILDIGNEKSRLAKKLVTCCNVEPKSKKIVFVNSDEGLIEVQ